MRTRSLLLWSSWSALPLALSLAACADGSPLPSPADPGDPTGADAGAPDATAPAANPPDAGPRPDTAPPPPCSPDLKTDPKNCGGCGKACAAAE